MWDTNWDAQRIDLELSWAAGLGLNAVRVFLHDLLWEEKATLLERLDIFLGLAHRHRIKVLLVLFDSCWDPLPRRGPQQEPVPGVHNSRWVQSPGKAALSDWAGSAPRLEDYVKGVVGRFADDPRVVAWDVWNEPDNSNSASYEAVEMRADAKAAAAAAGLPQVFGWVRSVAPSQPLTSGVWAGSVAHVAAEQIRLSDFVSFHSYGDAGSFENSVRELRAHGRPLWCTEYMARPFGSTVQSIAPVARREKVAIFNWGFVEGRTQTFLPWDSWQRRREQVPYDEVWFHDIYRKDGEPYRREEADFLRALWPSPPPLSPPPVPDVWHSPPPPGAGGVWRRVGSWLGMARRVSRPRASRPPPPPPRHSKHLVEAESLHHTQQR